MGLSSHSWTDLTLSDHFMNLTLLEGASFGQLGSLFSVEYSPTVRTPVLEAWFRASSGFCYLEVRGSIPGCLVEVQGVIEVTSVAT